jgi:hypothetical protein
MLTELFIWQAAAWGLLISFGIVVLENRKLKNTKQSIEIRGLKKNEKFLRELISGLCKQNDELNQVYEYYLKLSKINTSIPNPNDVGMSLFIKNNLTSIEQRYAEFEDKFKGKKALWQGKETKLFKQWLSGWLK